jgi:DNA-binding PadR family transcriptional regulator
MPSQAAARSANAFEFREGTLYPALHQLEKKGLIKARWRIGDNGRERKYYSLTGKGRKAAESYEKQWQQLSGCSECGTEEQVSMHTADRLIHEIVAASRIKNDHTWDSGGLTLNARH